MIGPLERRSDSNAEVVLGVDTHKDFHAAVVLTALGAVVQGRLFSATAAGYQELLAWVLGGSS